MKNKVKKLITFHQCMYIKHHLAILVPENHPWIQSIPMGFQKLVELTLLHIKKGKFETIL